MPIRPPGAPSTVRWSPIAASLFALAAAGAALALWPGLDLQVSAAFYRPGRGFLFATAPGYEALRAGFELARRAIGDLVGVFVVAAAVAGGLAARRRGVILGTGTRCWAFLLMALLVGPGLLVNVVLKEHWGRARPVDTVPFGGGHTFTAALQPSRACAHNCSFVAGDPSLGFYVQAFGYVRRRRQGAWLVGGLAAGGLIGLLRIGLGAHFLSDVIFCGLLVLGVNAALYLALFATGHRRAAPTPPAPA
ncbi:MAG: phosphatase PAP2 family protein [Rhodospirillaceae bacterium]|nr:phosphatase PAP2 family protein [Rhodospirillaceae bacterium]